MIKNLFTKHEHRSLSVITKEQAMQAAAWFWRSRHFSINFTSPFSFQGDQFYSKLGLRQSIVFYCSDESQNVGLDLSFSAELTDQGAVVGVVGAVLLLPVTVAVGAVSYIEYENDAQRLMNDFWAYLQSFPGNPQPPAAPATAPAWAQGQAPVPATAMPAARTCSSCGALIDADSKFCKHCGSKN
jgi:hypothetical protein